MLPPTKKKNSNLKMLKFFCLLAIVLMFQVSRACVGHNEEEQLAAVRQQSDEYFSSAYGYTPNPWGSAYYQPSVPGKYIINSIIFVSIFDSINMCPLFWNIFNIITYMCIYIDMFQLASIPRFVFSLNPSFP